MARLTTDREAQVRLHPRPAQVDVAVRETSRLLDVHPVVDGERRWLGRVEHGDRAVAELDLAGGELGVDGALGTPPQPCPRRRSRTRCARRRCRPRRTGRRPVWSRRSMKARCSPCSRRLATQPQTRTTDADVVDPQRPAQMGAHRGGLLGHGHGVPFVDSAVAPAPSAGAGRTPVTGAPVIRCRGPRPGPRSPRRPAAPATGRRRSRSGRTDTVPAASSSGPTITATRAPERSASLSWAFIERWS